MALLVAWRVLAASLAVGQVSVTFRDGQSPTPAYAGTRDSTIRDGAETPWQPDANYNGLDDFIGGAPDDAAALIRFDLSAVPPATAIRGAMLQVHVSADATGQTFPVYQCLQSWTPGGATWLQYDGVTAWAGAGATGASDHAGAPMGTLNAGNSGTVQVALTDAGVSVVQGWIAGSTPNQGLIVQNYGAAGTAVLDRFNSGSFVSWPQLVLALADGGSQVVDAGSDTTIANARDPQTVSDNTDHLNADGKPGAAALLAFDLSPIPPWSTITAATLVLDCPGDGTAIPYSVYQAARPWVEGEACWNTYAAGQPWSLPGADGPGDHGSSALGTLTGIGAPIPVALNATGLQVVQDWVRGVLPNDGFEIVEYNLGSDGIVCHAREETAISQRPGLNVVYLEGQLAFSGAGAVGGVGTPLGPFTLDRRRLDGVAIASGAPSLAVTVSASSPSAGFATDAGAASWASFLVIAIPAGASTSGAFFMRDPDAGRPSILASAGLPWQPSQQVQSVRTVRFSAVPGGATLVGGDAPFTVQAVDAVDVTTAAALSARLLQLDGGVARTATFNTAVLGGLGATQASGTAPTGAATLTVTDTRAETIQLCGSIASAPASERCAPVAFAQPDHLVLSLAGPGTASPLEGCAAESIRVQMVDDAGSPVASPSPASICIPTDAGLLVGPSTLAGESRLPPCVSGTLGPDGSAQLQLTPTFPVGVTIGAASPDVPGGSAIMPVEWVAGPPSRLATDLEPRDAPGPITLQVGKGLGYVRLTPRDACGFSALARSSEVILVIPDEVAVGASIPDFDAGVLDTPIQLAVCPPGAAPIAIRAQIAGQPLVDEAGAIRSVTITPRCGLQLVDVGCACGAGPSAGRSAVALGLLAVTLRAARRRRRSAAAP